ncbi:cysteine hydrolase family protein [Agrilactobacillus fermenti]|uniref:cysteine hydrolase family protein n=1 Tax=Agrilactobacillus fermenti TaxID=2586909 RepID=UPI001E514533|nr:isochorismatase family cysteine hydrolase [Agrilactobacillus fermenti]MCD2255322.1 cysteine hydrolase [Agrilactobacillus fermenti]
MTTPKALIIIDYTNDFVADQGSLTTGKPAQALDDFISQRAQTYLDQNNFIFLPTDVHVPNDPYHPESKLFPPHNVRNTWGRELFGKTGIWFSDHQADDHVIFLDKTHYNAFAGTNLDLLLRARHISEIELVGVVTDICILHTAVGAYDLSYDITIPEAGVASFNAAGHQWALTHFKDVLGATVIANS